MKLYKFYKDDCPPCYVMERLIAKIGIPDNTELVKMNVKNEENLKVAKANGIDIIPALMFEDGRILKGNKTEIEIKEFLQV